MVTRKVNILVIPTSETITSIVVNTITLKIQASPNIKTAVILQTGMGFLSLIPQ
jgi:hypothetical protein